MQAPNPSTQTPTQFPKAVPVWITVLVVGIGIAAASAVSDRGNRKKLEQVSETTSVGDKAYFVFSEDAAKALRFATAPLVCASKSPDPMPESQMVYAGETEDHKYRLYIPSERLNGNGELGGPSWYLKTGPGQFLRFTR
jgi:hypothetical protein